MLGFLEKVTLSPEKINQNDVQNLLKNGISKQAVADAVYVCVGFNIINRLADALGANVPAPQMFSRSARFLLRFGYQILSGLGFEELRGQFQQYRQKSRLFNAGDSKMNDENFDRYEATWKKLNRTVFEEKGFLDIAFRQAAGAADDLPEAAGSYLKKVFYSAFKVTDRDFSDLRAGGFSDEQIFEMTVCAAIGAGSVRLDPVLNFLNSRSKIL